MKILYIITKSEAGGAQTYVAQLGGYFKNRGHEVAVLSYPGGWLEDEAKKMGIKFFSNQYFSNSFCFSKFIKALKITRKVVNDFKPDLVHCHSSAGGVYGRLTVKNKIPTLYTAHGWGFNLGVPLVQKWLAILIEKYLAKYCTKIICVSEFVKDLALKYKIASTEKFIIIKNGVELLPEKINHSTGLVKVIFVGRLAPPKEPLMLLQAVKDLKQPLAVQIIGAGSKFAELQNFVLQNDLQNIGFSGELSREQTVEALEHADIFVLISKWEGLPLTILEAMSIGLPIIASNVGGIKEVVDKENGILLNNDIREIKLALEKLINDLELRKELGQAGRKKIVEKFNLQNMLKEIDSAYFKLLSD